MANPGRFLGIHYMQPADAFDCVEVICATATGSTALERACDAIRATKKLPIVLSKPIEGFLFNRLQHALLHEVNSDRRLIQPVPAHRSLLVSLAALS
jgi:3-hydroxybutyryl-CoA dehydrogenase